VERVELVEGVKTPAAWFYKDYKDWAEARASRSR
jgi:hypothetical protein